MPILTTTGTISSGTVIFDRTNVLGTSRGDKINLYLDFTRGGTETVTLSVAVKDSTLNVYHYISYLSTTNIVTKQPIVLNLTGKYVIPVVIGKDVEEIKIEQTGLTNSTLSINHGLDNYYS